MNTLTAAFEECRVLNRHYGTRFHAALNKLPRHLQPHVHGLCAFDRILLEMIRNPKPGITADQQLSAMKAWQQAFESGMNEELPNNVYLQAAVHSAKVLDLNEKLYADLVKSRQREHQTKSYKTFTALKKQINSSARPISQLIASLLQMQDHKEIKAIQRLAAAGELIEFLYDLPASLKRGVNYLNESDMKKNRCSEKTLQQEKMTRGCKKIVEQYVSYANKEISAATKILCTQKNKHADFFSTISESYVNLINQIQQKDFHVFSLSAKPTVSWKLKLKQAIPTMNQFLGES